LEREYTLRLQIKQRTLYPKILVLALIFIPGIPTLILVSPAAYFGGILHTWGPVALGLLLLWVALRYMLKGQSVRDFYDQVKLLLPVIGPLVRKMAAARFARSLAALYHAGVPLTSGVAASGEASGNAVLNKTSQRVVPALERGGSLTQALAATAFLPPMIHSMFATGEQAVDLDQVLDQVGDYYENEANHSTIQLLVIRASVVLFAFLW